MTNTPTGAGDPTGANVAAGANATLPPGVSAATALAGGGGGVGTGPGGGNQAIAPAASTSAYELSLVEGTKLVIGSWLAGMLNIPQYADTPVSGAEVLQAWGELPMAKQNAVMTFLWKAGFYVNQDGEIPSTQPDFNATDALNQNAITNAILVTYNKNLNASPNGTTLSSLTASQIYSGAGQQELQTAPSPVLGGANTYQVTLTSPSDLYNTLYTQFEQSLGRAPTQTELNGFVQTFQSEQAKYQQALNAQQEQASYAKFGQQEQARNTELAYSRTPQVAGGPVPSGPFHTPAAWATAFMQYLNQAEGVPITASNVAYILSIMGKLGTWNSANSTFNPLGVVTPYPGPGQVETGKPNPNAPAKYSSWSVGMQATLDELANYPGLLALLMTGDASSPKQQTASQAVGELAQWTNNKIKTPLTPSTGTTTAANHATAVYSRITAHNQTLSTAEGAIKGGTTGSTAQNLNAKIQAPTTQQAKQAEKGAAVGAGGAAVGAAVGAGTQQTFPGGGEAMQRPPTNSIQYRATHPPTGPGFSTAAIPPAGTAGAPKAPPQPAGVQQEPTIQQAKDNAQKQKQQAKGSTPDNRIPGAKAPAPSTPAPAMQQFPTQPTTPASALTSGQDQYSTGDTYVGANTLVGTQPPSAQGLAFTEATTGANAVPYQGNEYLDAFNTIADMIASGKVGG